MENVPEEQPDKKPEPDVKSKPVKATKAKWRKRLLLGLFVLLGVFLLIVVFLPALLTSNFVVGQGIGIAEQQVPLRIQLKQIRFGWFSTFNIEGLSVVDNATGKPLLELDSATAPISLFSIIKNGVEDLPPIEVNGLRASYIITESGETNIAALLASLPPSAPKAEEPAPEPAAGPTVVPINSFRFIAKDWLVLYEDNQNNQRLALRVDSVDAGMISADQPITLDVAGGVEINGDTLPFVVSGFVENALNKDRTLNVQSIIAELKAAPRKTAEPFFLLQADVQKRSGLVSTTLELPTLQRFAEPFVDSKFLVLKSGTLPIKISISEQAPDELLAMASVNLENLSLSTSLIPNAPTPQVSVPEMNLNATALVNVATQSLGKANVEVQTSWSAISLNAIDLQSKPEPSLESAEFVVQIFPKQLMELAAQVAPVPAIDVPQSELQLAIKNVSLKEGVLALEQESFLKLDNAPRFLQVLNYSVPQELVGFQESLIATARLDDQSFAITNFQVSHNLFTLQSPAITGSGSGPTATGELILGVRTEQAVDNAELFIGALPLCVRNETVLRTTFDYAPDRAVASGTLLFPGVELDQPMVTVPQTTLGFSAISDLKTSHSAWLTLNPGDSTVEVAAFLNDQDADVSLNMNLLTNDFLVLSEDLKQFATYVPEVLTTQLVASSNLKTFNTVANISSTISQPSGKQPRIYPLELNADLQGILNPEDPQLSLVGSFVNEELLKILFEVSNRAGAKSSLDVLVGLGTGLDLAAAFVPEQLPQERASISADSFLQISNTFALNLKGTPGAQGDGVLSLSLPEISSQEFEATVLNSALSLDYQFNSASPEPAALGTLKLQIPESYFKTFGFSELVANVQLQKILQQQLSEATLTLGPVQDLEKEIVLIPNLSIALNNLQFGESITLQQAIIGIADQISLNLQNFSFGNILQYSLNIEATSFDFLAPSLAAQGMVITGGTMNLSNRFSGPLPKDYPSLFNIDDLQLAFNATIPHFKMNEQLFQNASFNVAAGLNEKMLTIDLSSALEEFTTPDSFPISGINMIYTSSFSPEGSFKWDLSDLSIANLGTIMTSAGSISVPVETFDSSGELSDTLAQITTNGTVSLMQRLSGLEEEFPDYTMSGEAGIDFAFSSSDEFGFVVNPAMRATNLSLGIADLVSLRNLNGTWSPEYSLGILRPLANRSPKAAGEFMIQEITLEAGPRPVTLSGISIVLAGISNGIDLSLVISDMLQGSLSFSTSLQPGSIKNALSGDMQLVGLNLNAYNNPTKTSKETVNLLGTFSLPINRTSENPLDQLDVEVFTYDLEPDSIRKLIVAVTDALQLKTVSNALTLLRVSPPTGAFFLINYGLITFRTDITVSGGFTTPFYIVQNQPVSDVAALYSPDAINALYTQLILLQDVLQAHTVDELIQRFTKKETPENE